MNTVVRKLFKHGHSHAITLPREFVATIKNREVILRYSHEGVVISPKSRLDTLESEPLFVTFIRALGADAMKHPEKLHDPAEAWSPEVAKLFNEMADDDEA